LKRGALSPDRLEVRVDVVLGQLNVEDFLAAAVTSIVVKRDLLEDRLTDQRVLGLQGLQVLDPLRVCLAGPHERRLLGVIEQVY